MRSWDTYHPPITANRSLLPSFSPKQNLRPWQTVSPTQFKNISPAQFLTTEKYQTMAHASPPPSKPISPAQFLTEKYQSLAHTHTQHEPTQRKPISPLPNFLQEKYQTKGTQNTYQPTQTYLSRLPLPTYTIHPRVHKQLLSEHTCSRTRPRVWPVSFVAITIRRPPHRSARPRDVSRQLELVNGPPPFWTVSADTQDVSVFTEAFPLFML